MSELLDFSTNVTDLTSFSTEELRQALVQTIEVSALHILRMAFIWRELERRGVDLSDLRTGLFEHLPAIAAGRLDAGLVVRLAGKPSLLRRVQALPITEQRALAERGVVPIARLSADGRAITEQVPIERLNAAQVNRVFINGRIVDPARQAAGRAPKEAPEPKVQWLPGGIVRIGRAKVRLGDILAAMPEPQPQTHAGGGKPLALNLDEEQSRRLKARAALAGLSMQDYVVRSLWLTGAFDDV